MNEVQPPQRPTYNPHFPTVNEDTPNRRRMLQKMEEEYEDWDIVDYNTNPYWEYDAHKRANLKQDMMKY